MGAKKQIPAIRPDVRFAVQDLVVALVSHRAAVKRCGETGPMSVVDRSTRFQVAQRLAFKVVEAREALDAAILSDG
jgi:hypothetical protein